MIKDFNIGKHRFIIGAILANKDDPLWYYTLKTEDKLVSLFHIGYMKRERHYGTILQFIIGPIFLCFGWSSDK